MMFIMVIVIYNGLSKMLKFKIHDKPDSHNIFMHWNMVVFASSITDQ